MPKHQIDPKLVALNGYGMVPRLIETSSTGTDRLGLRYTLLQRGFDGRYKEVLPGTPFRSGDVVRLSVMTNRDGYLYVIQKGSSGNWGAIYPSTDAKPESNYILSGRTYEVPFDGGFRFNDQPGQENLYILLSLEPIKDLDGEIFNLQQTRASPPAAGPGPMLETSNRITDELVKQLISRDLVPVQEQVNTPANDAGQQSEKAIYVVSAQAEGKTVVAQLVLDHR